MSDWNCECSANLPTSCNEERHVSSLVSVVGTIVNPIRRTDEELCRFSVENEDGRFYIQAPWTPQLKQLRQSEQVQIIGQLHSFHFKRCRCNHVYIEPLIITKETEQDMLIALAK